MNNFRMDNTEGFAEKELDDMNALYEQSISELDNTDGNYENDCQNIAEDILDANW